MLYVQIAFVVVSIFYAVRVDAKPLGYQDCVDGHVDQFRKGELDASKDLQRSLTELKSFPEMQETLKRNYVFGVMLRKKNLDLALKVSKALCTD
jgi:hypothetical protein